MGKLIGMLVCLIFSAYFSATETAFTSANRIKLRTMANDGNRKAKKVLDLLEDYDSLLSTILVGNNIVNIALTAISTVFFLEYYPVYGPTVSTIVVTIVVLTFGEISPKGLAKDHAERFSMFSAPLLKFFMVILTPVNAIFSAWKRLLSKIFKTKMDAAITGDELITMVEEAEDQGGIDEDQSELIQNAIEFNDIEAIDVLRPRTEIIAIECDTPKDEIEKIFMETGHSRLPVYDGDLDNILGVLNQKEFHYYVKDSDVPVSEYISPVIFVAGSIKLSLLLKKMQMEKTHMAFVVDEYGGTSGLVTIEDILEELVGEIYDEHDQEEEADIVKIAENRYKLRCSGNLEKMLDYFDVQEEFDVTTVNGWVMLRLDKIPELGDKFTYEADYKHFEVEVTAVDDKRASEIIMDVTEIRSEDDDDEEKGE